MKLHEIMSSDDEEEDYELPPLVDDSDDRGYQQVDNLLKTKSARKEKEKEKEKEIEEKQANAATTKDKKEKQTIDQIKEDVYQFENMLDKKTVAGSSIIQALSKEKESIVQEEQSQQSFRSNLQTDPELKKKEKVEEKVEESAPKPKEVNVNSLRAKGKERRRRKRSWILRCPSFSRNRRRPRRKLVA